MDSGRQKLLFIGGPDRNGGIASTARATSQLFSVDLLPMEKDPNNNDVDTEAQAEAADAAPAPDAAAGAPRPPWMSKSRGTVSIAALIRSTHVAGSVSSVVPAPDSRTYLFIAERRRR